MIEVLDVTGHSTCANCGEPITRYWGDLQGDRWSHDASRKKWCGDPPMATPTEIREPEPNP